MDENATPADTDRSPFRRFPYGQLVFCIACLTMAAWTWMRYSYCWEMRGDQAWPSYNEEAFLDGSTWVNRMVLVRGRVTYAARWPSEMLPEMQRIGIDPPVWEGLVALADSRHPYLMGVICSDMITKGENGVFVGRIGDYFAGTGRWYVYTTASRFHGASVAGLVVGAMGCFIFSLYLRRWVKERRANR
jgi:hypothetical protein